MSPHLSSTTIATLAGRGLTLHRGVSPVLVDVDMTVGPESRVGVIGPNGVGKTTLLRVLAGQVRPDSGSVRTVPPTATVGYLPQELEAREGERLSDLLARRTGIAEAEGELAQAADALATGGPHAQDRYAVALERYLSLGVPDFEGRRGEVLHDLGLDARLLDVPTVGLSGGQRARASLASLLLSRFDVLLMDEPTNDLDFDGLERLEAFLRERAGGWVVVSHDRAFLEKVVSEVLEIDEASHRATAYAGGFTAYLEARATARRHADEAYQTYVQERERLRTREREQRQWAVQGISRERKNPRDNDKAQRDFRINRTQKQASKVRITERALERLDVVEKPFESWQLHLDLKAGSRSGDVVVRLEGVVACRDSWQLGPVDLEISWGERVAVLGPNGSGKSSLLAVILGHLDPSEGRRTLGSSVVVGRLGQERDRFSAGNGDGATLIERFLQLTGLTVAEGRSLLAKFGLGADHVERDAGSLSPGERTRAELALFMATGTNCLVLDEPTNHLDLPAIEQLESALSQWPGTLLLVSHDRRFLDAVELTRRITLETGQVVDDRAT
jgi:ATPase subunit of ABC transporter with duplicated ATPase domains